MIEEQPDAVPFDVGDLAVRKVVPVGCLAAQEERQPANAVIREVVGDEDGDVAGRVELTGAQCSADSRIAPADNEQLAGHEVELLRWSSSSGTRT